MTRSATLDSRHTLDADGHTYALYVVWAEFDHHEPLDLSVRRLLDGVLKEVDFLQLPECDKQMINAWLEECVQDQREHYEAMAEMHAEDAG